MPLYQFDILTATAATLFISVLEVWARTRQRNICAEIPVSRSITSRSERVQRHNAQSDGGQSTDTVSERVPTRQRTANEQRESQDEARTKQEKTKNWTPKELRKNSTNRGRTMENECLQRSNTGVFRCVLCEGYNYTPYAFTVHCGASESRYRLFWKQNYKSLLQVSILQTVWIIKATQYFIIIHNVLQQVIINFCCVVNQK